MSTDVSACREKLREAITAAKAAEQSGGFRATLDPLHDAVASAAADVLLAESLMGSQRLRTLRMHVAYLESFLLGLQKLAVPKSSEPSGFTLAQLPQSVSDTLDYLHSEEFKQFELTIRGDCKHYMLRYFLALLDDADAMPGAPGQVSIFDGSRAPEHLN